MTSSLWREVVLSVAFIRAPNLGVEVAGILGCLPSVGRVLCVILCLVQHFT